MEDVMSRRVLIAASLITMFAAGSAVAIVEAAQGGGGLAPLGRPVRGGPRVVARQLGLGGIELTDAQLEQIRSIAQAHRVEFQQASRRVRQAQRALRPAIAADAIDETAIRARSGDVAAALADAAVLRARVRGEVLGILTPEQQQELKERQRRF